MAATLSIKVTSHPPLTNDMEIRRFAIKEEDISFRPGGHAALSGRIAEAFSLAPGSFKIMYMDDEGDTCVTSSDAETQDAVRLAMLNTPPILRLTIKASGPAPVAASTQLPTSADPNLTLLLASLANKLPQVMASLPEAVQRMLPNAELDVDATIAATRAAERSLAGSERAADPAAEGVHYGVTCDRSGMSPIVGHRYNLFGQNYDLCEAEFAKLDPKEQRLYVKIPGTSFGTAATAAAAATSGCGWGPRRGFCGRRAPHMPMGEKLAARFVRDVSIFDGTQMAPGTAFTKIWRIKNIGEVPWPTGARMLFVGGDQMSAEMSVPVTHVGPVMPGEEVDVAVEMVAPTELGRYLGNWRLTGPHMRRKFGQRVWCHVQVVDPSKPFTESEMNDMFTTAAAAAERANADAEKDDLDADPDADGDTGEAMPKPGWTAGDGGGGAEQDGKPAADLVAWPASDDEVVLVGRPGEPAEEDAPPVQGTPLPPPASSSAAACAAASPLSSSSAATSSAGAAFAGAASAAASAGAAAESKMPLPLPPAPAASAPAASAPAEEVGSTLFEMGFTDASLVAHVLEKNGANLDACMHDLSAIQGWEAQLSDLSEMGFADAEKNKILLLKHKGELKAVVRELVSGN